MKRLMNAAHDVVHTSSAARTLGVTEGTVRKWADSGRIPMVRGENGARLYLKSAVDKLAAERAAHNGRAG